MAQSDPHIISESKLKEAIGGYLDDYVVQPAVGLVNSDLQAQDDIANLLVLHRLLRDLAQADAGKPLDQYLLSLLQGEPGPDIELAELLSRPEESASRIAELRTVFCSYVFHLANWACISVLSASYLSALIITRSLLELLVNVGAGKTGGMSERIGGLEMLADDEKSILSECWRDLSGWSHSHRRWLKKLCPVLIARGPLHHPRIARECLVSLGICTDLAFAIAFDKFAVDPEVVRVRCVDNHVDYRRFLLLRRRIDRK